VRNINPVKNKILSHMIHCTSELKFIVDKVNNHKDDDGDDEDK
jgi:hypothetical protein